MSTEELTGLVCPAAFPAFLLVAKALKKRWIPVPFRGSWVERKGISFGLDQIWVQIVLLLLGNCDLEQPSALFPSPVQWSSGLPDRIMTKGFHIWRGVTLS
jgi:hypothetical protein